MKLLLVDDEFRENQDGHWATFRHVERVLETHDDAWVGGEIRIKVEAIAGRKKGGERED